MVTYFSELELDLIKEEDNMINYLATTLPATNASATIETTSTSSQKTTNTFNHYSCVLDRNRMINLINEDQPTPNDKYLANTINFNNEISSNINLFYEIIKSMPELSKLQIK